MLQISKKRIKEIADDGWIWVETLKGKHPIRVHSEEASQLAKELLKLLFRLANAN